MGNMERLETIVSRLPEASRVDIVAWGGEPTFRVGGKNFIFAGVDGRTITVKLTNLSPAKTFSRTLTLRF